MSDKVYEVPAAWIKRAFIKEADYKKMYEHSLADPDGFWAEHGKRIDWIKPSPRSRTPRSTGRRVDQVVRGRHAERRVQLPRPPPRGPRRPGRDHLGRRRPEGFQAHHLSRAARAGLPPRQRAAQPRRQEGRPRHDLSADDPGGGRRACWPAPASARSIRWCSAASRRTASPAASRTASRTSLITADEGLRGGRKVPLKANADAALDKVGGVEHVIVVKRTGGAGRHAARPRRLVPRGRRHGVARLPAAPR